VKSCDNIYFVGMMGAGKTTVGRQLARHLKKRFVDCDHEVEARTGVRIPVIFEIEGEGGFRRREAQVLQELTTEHDLVLATGGGVVLDAENRARLRASGLVVYLCVSPAESYARTRRDRNRPLLQVPDPLARLSELFVQRDPLYREVADIIVESGGRAAASVVRSLQQEIQQRCDH